MTDNVTITFSADISDLQRGMQQAAAAVDATTNALRNSASQVSASFSSLSGAYTQSATQAVQASRSASATQIAIARDQADAQYQIALDGVKMQDALVKEQTQTSQISRQQQLQSLLALEDQREALERKHLQAVQATYAQNSDGYARTQAKIQESEAGSALRRQQIELDYNKEVDADYRRTFDQIGSTVSSSIMGMIQGHESLRQAAQKVLLAMIQDFVQAQIRMVANSLAGVATETTAVQVGQAAQTAAVSTGAAARAATATEGLIPTLLADAKAAFGGVFAFLAPIMGPAAAGPAAAAGALVTAHAAGAWELGSDHVAMVHQGEMIVPAKDTPWAQSRLSGEGGRGDTHYHTHNWQVSVNGARKPADVVDEIGDNIGKIGRMFARQFNLRPV